MTLQAEYAALAHGSNAITEVASTLSKEHDRVAAQVADLLAGRWQGEAATRFGSAWDTWCKGMRELLSGLGLESAAIDLTRAELCGSDGQTQAAMIHLTSRLGGTQ